MSTRSCLLGSVVLLESETGSGKTEAAVAHGHRLYRAGLVDGIYFALPTRTSGVQIHGRLQKAVAAAFGDAAPPVLLAVPGYMMQGAAERGTLGGQEALWDEGAAFTRSDAAAWFAENAKRYLAAPMAAGTIDQALMAVLKSKHGHMRAASLSRSLLVIDEIHASDDYMSELTAVLVRRHVEDGGHAFLMSATLGSEAARRYVGGGSLSLAAASRIAYPLIRWRAGPHGDPTPVDARPGPGEEVRRKSVRLSVSHAITDDAAVAHMAAGHARRGAKVLVIRNTVDACVGVRRALASVLPPEAQFRCAGNADPNSRSRMTPAPHHGRFAPEDRRLLDASVEVAFGKQRASGGMVLVATQTVEQSLDIDADILITDICPMDVLLQRIGRLHRHRRPDAERGLGGRPDGYADPVCVVLAPEGGLLPLVIKAAYGIGKDRAYQDVRVAELTLRQIQAKGTFVIPDMNRELVESCVHSEARLSLDAEVPSWADHGVQVLGKGAAERATALSALLPVDHSFGDPEQFAGWRDVKHATRLGEGAVTAMFPEGTRPRSPFSGRPLPFVNIPHWMAPPDVGQAREGLVPHIVSECEGSFVFRLGDRSYEYDADGLRRLRER